MIKTLVTNREWGTFSHTHAASAVKACLGRAEVAKRLLFITFAVVASFVGQTAHAQNDAWDATITPSAANGQEVYLYNVGTKQFLGRGGRWGTEANMNVEGTMFTLTYNSSKNTFTLTSPMHSDHGSQLTLMDGVVSVHDEGNYFLDQKGSAFTVTEVKSGTEVKGYKISSVAENSGDNGLVVKGKTYYMVASGVYQKAYAKLATEDWVAGDSTDYATWIIVTHQQRKEAFEKVNNAHEAAVNATFLMSDFDFARNDTECSEWKTGATSAGTTTGTLELGNKKNLTPSDAIPSTTKVYTYTSTHDYKSSFFVPQSHTSTITTTEDHGETWERECQESSKHATGYKKTVTYTKMKTEDKVVEGYTYYLGNGYDEAKYTVDPITGETLSSEMHLQESYGGAWTANIHGKRGSVVQTIPATNMIKEGWYRVSCVGFTTTTKGIARLYAAAGKGNTTGSATAESKKFAIASLHKIDPASKPATYVAASKLLDTPNVNTYDASVMVYVGINTETDKKETLSFGIQVGSAVDETQNADDDAWTCFDNFKIEYLGMPPYELVLDEDQTDAGYIKAQAPELDNTQTLQKSTVYLHRNMNTEKWNSLVLPINLNVAQVKRIFGDQVHISKFVGAKADHPQRIVFDPITADRNDPDAIAIEAGKLYLVKPTAEGGMLKGQEKKEFTYNGNTISVTDYYRIVGVTFKKKSEIADNDYSGRVMGDTGSEEFGTAKHVQFVGTYVKCFDTNNIPANSYVLNGNNVGGTAGLWYYRTVTTNTKGFRGWLQPANGQSAKGIEYEIEGVVDQVNGDVTAIEGIEAEQQHSGNIYNLNGQLVRQGATSTEGLPSGLYIVGGKKVVVK